MNIADSFFPTADDRSIDLSTRPWLAISPTGVEFEGFIDEQAARRFAISTGDNRGWRYAKRA